MYSHSHGLVTYSLFLCYLLWSLTLYRERLQKSSSSYWKLRSYSEEAFCIRFLRNFSRFLEKILIDYYIASLTLVFLVMGEARIDEDLVSPRGERGIGTFLKLPRIEINLDEGFLHHITSVFFIAYD